MVWVRGGGVRAVQALVCLRLGLDGIAWGWVVVGGQQAHRRREGMAWGVRCRGEV